MTPAAQRRVEVADGASRGARFAEHASRAVAVAADAIAGAGDRADPAPAPGSVGFDADGGDRC